MEHFPIKDRLHTDVLEEKYGPVHADVLYHDDQFREARLVDEKGISRTHTLTFFEYDRSNAEISKINDEIQAGGLIGKVFREHGYTIKKNVIDVFMMPLTSKMKGDFQTDNDEAKARISEFYAKKGGEDPVIYGKVLEIYSPDFRDPKDGLNDIDMAQVNPTVTFLMEDGLASNYIWSKLDNVTSADRNIFKDHAEAKEKSQILVKDLHERIEKYFADRK